MGGRLDEDDVVDWAALKENNWQQQQEKKREKVMDRLFYLW